MRLQLNSALRELLRDEPRTILLGEDLQDPYGGAFKVTAGLSTDYPGRVISTPISEAAVVGTGIGLALSGYRPVVEIMFADFVTLCMDQLFNHAVKFPGMYPNTDVPLVIRTPSGGGRGLRPHAQSVPREPPRRRPGPDGRRTEPSPSGRRDAEVGGAAVAESHRVPGAQAAVRGTGFTRRLRTTRWR